MKKKLWCALEKNDEDENKLVMDLWVVEGITTISYATKSDSLEFTARQFHMAATQHIRQPRHPALSQIWLILKEARTHWQLLSFSFTTNTFSSSWCDPKSIMNGWNNGGFSGQGCILLSSTLKASDGMPDQVLECPEESYLLSCFCFTLGNSSVGCLNSAQWVTLSHNL